MVAKVICNWFKLGGDRNTYKCIVFSYRKHVQWVLSQVLIYQIILSQRIVPMGILSLEGAPFVRSWQSSLVRTTNPIVKSSDFLFFSYLLIGLFIYLFILSLFYASLFLHQVVEEALPKEREGLCICTLNIFMEEMELWELR